MSIIIKDPRTELPPAGTHRAVIADMVDHGTVKTPWGWKPMLRIVFLLETENANGLKFAVSQAFTKSLAQTAKLRQFLDALELKIVGTVDLEALLVGLQVTLTIVHPNEGGILRARVEAVKLREMANKYDRVEIPLHFKQRTDIDGTGTTDEPAVTKERKERWTI